MGKRLTTAGREKKRVLSRAKRFRENAEFLDKYGIPENRATPGNMMRVSVHRRQVAKRKDEFEKLLTKAKILSVVNEEFEYFGLGAKSGSILALFKQELQNRMSTYLGKKEPDIVLDTVTFDYLQEVVDSGDFTPVKPSVGSVPKVRKFNRTGRIKVMRHGEPDYDFLVSKLRV